MVRISHTNIIVDEFSTARNNPFNKYIHFLTHIHADHLKGLSNSWDYGTIYCSKVTKQLILLKYPRLKCLKQLELQKQYTIPLSSQLEITATLFDANHCAGGVMILLQGYMGTVLYTGDLRFDRELFSEYSYLYPHSRRNKQFKKCSIDIDFLYLDTTFLHPKFDFPSKQKALNHLEQYIQTTISKAKEENKFIEFYIGIDSFGKEEVLLHLADKFQTLITVTEERYKNISLMGLDVECFTTDAEKGFIHIVLKRQLKQFVADKQNAIGIILTGWANKPHSRSPKTYAIPYSLHSSYPELVQFVDSIRPCFIQSILEVSLSSRKPDQINRPSASTDLFNNSNDTELYEDINTSEYLNKLRNQYTTKPSNQLVFMMTNVDFQKKIKQKLKLDRTSTEISKEQFGMTMVRVENINRAGAKLKAQRNQQEIQKIKEKLKTRKEKAISIALSQIRTKKIQQPTHSQSLNQNIPLQMSDDLIQCPNKINQSYESSQKSASSKFNSSSESKNSKQQEINHSKQLEQESQVTKKNKWIKKVQEGEIDLFGKFPTLVNVQSNQRITHSENLRNNTISINKLKKIRKNTTHQKVIELSDSDDETNKKTTNSSSKSQRSIRNKKNSQEKKNSSEKKGYEDSIEITLPLERQPDQRSIMEFFSKPRKNQERVNQPQEIKAVEPVEAAEQMQAEEQQESSQVNQIIEKKKQLSAGEKLVKKFSIFDINQDRLNEFKEAPPSSFMKFFINKKK